MLESIPSRLLSEWMAYERISPFPDPTYNTALLCSVVANVNGAKTKPRDFMPDQPKPAVDSMTLKAKMLAYSAARKATS